jgi:hypothetical protein
MRSQHEGVRTTLKILGPLFILAGVVLIVFGIQEVQKADQERDERWKRQSKEFMAGKRDMHDIEHDHGPPAGIFMIGGGGFAVMIGLAMLVFAFQGAFLRYQARVYAPIVKETLREVAPGLVGGPVHTCPQCHTENPADAHYCKQCGGPLALTRCPGCGTPNDPGANFCTRCGKRL